MSNAEVAGLKSLAKAAGGTLTTNPHTGLYEAGALDSILPLVAGAALSMTGIGAPAAAALVGAEEGIRQKNWKAGLAAGLGAFGGAGLGSAVSSIGANAADAAAASGASGVTIPDAGNLATLEQQGPTALTSQGLLSGTGLEGAAGQAPASALTSGATAVPASSVPTSMSNFGQGLSSLANDPMSATSKLGDAGFGRLSAATLAAPAIYQASQPAGPTPPTVTKYETENYDPRTQLYSAPTWNTWTDQGSGSGMAKGGLAKYASGGGTFTPPNGTPVGFAQAGGGAGAPAANYTYQPSQSAIAQYYQSLMQPPAANSGGAPIQPPSPASNNQFMSALNSQIATNPRVGGTPISSPSTAPPTSPTPTNTTGTYTPGPSDKPPTLYYDPTTGQYTTTPPSSGGITSTPRPVGGTDPRINLPSGMARGGIARYDSGGDVSGPPQYTYDPTTGQMKLVSGNAAYMSPSGASSGTPPNLDNLSHPGTVLKDSIEHPLDVMGNLENRPNTAATVLDPLGLLNQNGSFNSANAKSDLNELPHIASLGLFKAAGGPISSGGLGSFSDGGRMVKGPGDGMSDDVPATIHGATPTPAALGDGEFVVPADVVSHLGNGSTDAGAKRLYSMLDRVRQARTGTMKQGKQINAEKFLPR